MGTPARAALNPPKTEAFSLCMSFSIGCTVLQVAAMLANDPSLRVAPLPGPSAQLAMPPSASRFALEFRYCLERVRWTASRWDTLLMQLHIV